MTASAGKTKLFRSWMGFFRLSRKSTGIAGNWWVTKFALVPLPTNTLHSPPARQKARRPVRPARRCYHHHPDGRWPFFHSGKFAT
jgi:hypothetical protein